MRKIVILLILSIALVIGGGIVFAMEIGQIQVTEEEVKGEKTSFTETVSSDVSNIDIDTNILTYYEVDGDEQSYYSGNEMNIKKMEEDDSLNENEIKVVYNDCTRVNFDTTDQTMTLNFDINERLLDDTYDYKYMDASKFLDIATEMWKTKNVTSKTFSDKVYDVEIYYGKNLEGKIKVINTYDNQNSIDESDEDSSEEV